MGIGIGGGIKIGPGIKVVGTSLIRSALSAAAQANYDSATVGNFIRVSATDYNNVRTMLANTKTIGDNADAILYPGTAYSGTCAAVNSQANSNVDANFYIVGYVSRHQSVSGALFKLLISDTFKGTYTQLGNSSLVATSSGPSYYIRKDPIDAAVSTKYLGVVSNTGSMIQSNTNWTNAGYDCNAAGPPFNAWANRTATQPVFQALLCGTLQW